MEKKKRVTNCESCEFYDYDEELDAYVCNMSLDEDEMIYFLKGQYKNCPYFQAYDEYKIARKQ